MVPRFCIGALVLLTIIVSWFIVKALYRTAMSVFGRTAGTAHRVDPNLFIGGYMIAADPDFIRRAGITRIVKMFADDPSYYGGYHRHPGVKYFVAAAKDIPSYDIRKDAAQAVAFVREGVAAGDRTLVHCHAGVSRSATVIILHLMILHGWDYDTALGRLRLVRPIVNPNPGFEQYLRAADANLQAQRNADWIIVN